MTGDSETECAEVSGKTVKKLSVHQNRFDGTEVQVDFTDGTSLSICVANQQRTEASLLICGGPGEPEVLRKYDLP